MKELAVKSCTPCHGAVSPLSIEASERLRAQVSNWHLFVEDDVSKLSRFYEFADFKGALAFTQQIGEIAEQEGHHPVLVTEWGKVTVVWWTHAIGGLHENDFVMAAKTDFAYMGEV